MKRYITSIAIILCILCGMAGCIKEDYLDNSSTETTIDPNCVLLTLQSGKNVDNRIVTMEHNEDLLKTVSVFFFPASGDDGKLEFFQTGIKVENNQVQIPLEPAMNGKAYTVYVIANYDIETDDDIVADETGIKIEKATLTPQKGLTTIDDLKTLVLTTVFRRDKDDPEPSFVMDGQAESVKIDLGTALEQPIELERVASRIQLYAKFKDFEETKSDGRTYKYTAITESAEITLYNAVGRTYFLNDPLYKPTPSDVMNPRMRTMKEYQGTEDKRKGYLYNEIPFYSYANDWSHDSGLATYLELSVVWEESVGDYETVVRRYYYQVPITTIKKLVRNNAYQITVDVSMLGSETPTEAVTLSGDLEVIPWTEVQFSSDLNRYKYLSVDPDTAILYNTASAQFKYSSSSPIKVEITDVSYIDYSDQNNTSTEIDDPQKEGFNAYVVGNEIHFNHKINKKQQFYPYTITLTVTNEDDDVKPQIIKIVQYPAIYVSAEKDSEITGDNQNINRFVYGTYRASGISGTLVKLPSGLEVGRVQLLSNSPDHNPNQYNIYITAFDEDDGLTDGRKYVIGDPRDDERQVDQISFVNKYRQTKEEAEVQNMVAPIYKVASSWGSTASLPFESAKERCAVYQENGYPAGRWRIPTEAEIEYIVNLSTKNQIPILFNTEDGSYYAASGKKWNGTQWQSGNGSYYGTFVRCVYDVWYWGDDKLEDKAKFVWGDNPDGSLKDDTGNYIQIKD